MVGATTTTIVVQQHDHEAAIWLAIIVGLGSGVIGTLATIAYQLGAARRARRLDAAGAFLEAADAFRRTVRSPQASTVESSVKAIHDAWDDLVPTVNLVRLLYGWESAIANSAGAAAGAFEEVARFYDRGAPEQWQDRDRQRVDELMPMADEYLRWFAERAAGGPVRKWRLRWRVWAAQLRNRRSRATQ